MSSAIMAPAEDKLGGFGRPFGRPPQKLLNTAILRTPPTAAAFRTSRHLACKLQLAEDARVLH